MTITATNDSDGPYVSNGVTTVFPYTFAAMSDAEVSVAVDEETISTSLYTVSRNAGDEGGSVTFLTAPADGAVVVPFATPEFTQDISFTNAGPFLASSHDEGLDRAAVRAIYLNARLDRSGLAAGIDRAGKYLAFDSNGVPTASSGIGADAAMRTDLAAPAGSALTGFLQSGSGATARTVQAKLRDTVSAKDFGAAGDNAADDGAELALAVAAASSVFLPSGTYKNTSVSLTLPFGKTMKFDSGASISSSGSGSATLSGVTIREGYNPDSLTGWTGSAAYSYEGLSVELGGYGPRQFGSFGTPTALNGSTNIPSTATIANHATGVSGYVKNASTTTGGVALYGEANRTAASALVWGFNTRSQDNGFGGGNVWGYEVDLNIDNVTTTALGIDIVGASTVEPTNSIAVNVQAIGVFASPKKRWQKAFRTTDGSALIGMELGSQLEAAASPSQILQLNYRNGAAAPVTGLALQVSGAGDASITGGIGTTLFALKTPTSSTNQIQMLANALGFFGASPANKPTGVAVTAAGIHAALVTLGLIAA